MNSKITTKASKLLKPNQTEKFNQSIANSVMTKASQDSIAKLNDPISVLDRLFDSQMVKRKMNFSKAITGTVIGALSISSSEFLSTLKLQVIRTELLSETLKTTLIQNTQKERSSRLKDFTSFMKEIIDERLKSLQSLQMARKEGLDEDILLLMSEMTEEIFTEQINALKENYTEEISSTNGKQFLNNIIDTMYEQTSNVSA